MNADTQPEPDLAKPNFRNAAQIILYVMKTLPDFQADSRLHLLEVSLILFQCIEKDESVFWSSAYRWHF
jgi:hypothetical protein